MRLGARKPAAQRALAVLSFAALGLLAAPAAAQNNPYGTRAERGFGNRDSFVFSVENIFGFEHAELGEDNSDTSFDSKPMHPLYWGNLGFFGVYDSGLTLGAVGGVVHVFKEQDDYTILQIRPRIGYAGSLTPYFGYWVRGGPSFFTQLAGDSHIYVLSAGAEAYGVITPVPHFGILFGPNFDISIYGRDQDGNKAKLTQYGLMSGLFGEFW